MVLFILFSSQFYYLSSCAISGMRSVNFLVSTSRFLFYVQNFGNSLFYSVEKKVANLLKSACHMVLLLKHVFRPLFEVFWPKIRKLWTLEELETMIEKECFSDKKYVFIFLKAFFTKTGSRKISRWWPAVLFCLLQMWAPIHFSWLLFQLCFRQQWVWKSRSR